MSFKYMSDSLLVFPLNKYRTDYKLCYHIGFIWLSEFSYGLYEIPLDFDETLVY